MERLASWMLETTLLETIWQLQNFATPSLQPYLSFGHSAIHRIYVLKAVCSFHTVDIVTDSKLLMAERFVSDQSFQVSHYEICCSGFQCFIIKPCTYIKKVEPRSKFPTAKKTVLPSQNSTYSQLAIHCLLQKSEVDHWSTDCKLNQHTHASPVQSDHYACAPQFYTGHLTKSTESIYKMHGFWSSIENVINTQLAFWD